MKQLIICICILIIIASCELSNSPHSPIGQDISKPDEVSNDKITVFLTGNVLGSLKPCGCSGGQLGGLDRRPVVFNTVPVDKRLLIDTGSIVNDNRLEYDETVKEQNLIKFFIITEAFDYLNYDIVNLTKPDLETARIQGLLDNPAINYITPYENDEDIAPGYKNHYSLDGEDVNILALSFDPQEMALDYIKEIFRQEPNAKNVNILILNNESKTDFDEIIEDISQLGVVDCIVCPINSDEPTVLSERGVKPLVCAVGRYGRHISSLVIENTQDNTLKLSFDYVRLEEEVESDKNLVNLYERYQDIVKDAELLGKNLRVSHDNGLKYVGSEICSTESCHPTNHQYEYIIWLDTDHAGAYKTLVEDGSQYDPECIVCHVVGYNYESGFKTAEKTPNLKNVGCEYCHGPGSAHCENPFENKTVPIEDVEKLCLKCHTPEHSGDFAGHEEEKIKLIDHL